tara:strand:- start:945 stop:2165 length:1221 start_codon:yes stop_codon:yes gene_type:complete
MENPTIAFIPSYYKEAKAYSVLPVNGDGDISFSRNSIATMTNTDGLIQTLGNNEPRIVKYKDRQDGCSLLLEPFSQNKFEYSEDYSQSEWSKSNCTITENDTLAPDGTTSATLLTTVNPLSFSFLQQQSLSLSTKGTISYYCKQSVGDTADITAIGSGLDGQAISTYRFLFSTEEITHHANGDAAISTGVEKLANGWYRISVTYACTTITGARLQVRDGGTDVASLYIWGAQAESNNLSSYIPTSGVPVSRQSDAAQSTGLGDYIGDGGGTLFVEAAGLPDANTNRGICISSGSASDRVLIRWKSNGTQLQFIVTESGSTQVSTTIALTQTDFNKIAITYELNNVKMYLNGALVATDTSMSIFDIGTLDELEFSEGSTSNRFYGKVEQIKVYDKVLTEDEAKALTS